MNTCVLYGESISYSPWSEIVKMSHPTDHLFFLNPSDLEKLSGIQNSVEEALLSTQKENGEENHLYSFEISESGQIQIQKDTRCGFFQAIDLSSHRFHVLHVRQLGLLEDSIFLVNFFILEFRIEESIF